jgi:hypothetical protein
MAAQEPVRPWPPVAHTNMGFTAFRPSNPAKVLGLGAHGTDIEFLQHKLDNLGLSGHGLVCHGRYDGATYNAVKEFQRRAKITIDGLCGLETWSALLQKEP